MRSLLLKVRFCTIRYSKGILCTKRMLCILFQFRLGFEANLFNSRFTSYRR